MKMDNDKSETTSKLNDTEVTVKLEKPEETETTNVWEKSNTKLKKVYTKRKKYEKRKKLDQGSEDEPIIKITLKSVCDVCNKVLTNSAAVWKHKKRMHNEKIHSCSYCGLKFAYNVDVRCHEKTYHLPRPNLYVCKFEGCGRTFKREDRLRKHKVVHSEERPFLCPNCGIGFKHYRNFKIHELRHTGVKPVKCKYCEFSCRQKTSLNFHLQKYHSIPDCGIHVEDSELKDFEEKTSKFKAPKSDMKNRKRRQKISINKGKTVDKSTVSSDEDPIINPICHLEVEVNQHSNKKIMFEKNQILTMNKINFRLNEEMRNLEGTIKAEPPEDLSINDIYLEVKAETQGNIQNNEIINARYIYD